MNLKETIKELELLIQNGEAKPFEKNPSWSELSSELGIDDLYWSDDERLKSYWVQTHFCTDTYVGLSLYFLDGEFVCIELKPARKSTAEFEFFSNKKVEQLKLYLESLVEKDESNYLLINFNEYEDNILEYHLDYSSQLISQFHKFGYYDGEKVEIMSHYDDYENLYDVLIKYPNNDERWIDVRDIKFKGLSYYNPQIYGYIKIVKDKE